MGTPDCVDFGNGLQQYLGQAAYGLQQIGTLGSNLNQWMGGVGISSIPLEYPSCKIRFFRINEKAEMAEGEKFIEPLDELRLKVAKWLHNQP